MKAFVLDKYDSPLNLKLQEIEKPQPKAQEVQVRVACVSINDWDWSLIRGRPYIYRLFMGMIRPKTKIPGTDVAGVVEAIGSGVSALQVGDRVFGDLSEDGFGAFAEHVCASEKALTKMPDGMSFAAAAALPHASILAFQSIVKLGRIRDGMEILINGAGGGVGTIGVQIAKQWQVQVTGVDHGSKQEAMLQAGFDKVIDYQQTDFCGLSQKFDLVIDTKTTRLPWSLTRALKKGGEYITVGGSLPRLLLLLCLGPILKLMTGKGLRLLALKPNEGLVEINRLFQSGAVSPTVEGPYEFASLPQATQSFGEANHKGKVIIQVCEQEG